MPFFVNPFMHQSQVDIINDLAKGAEKSKAIAKAIENGRIKVNFLTDELFEREVLKYNPNFRGNLKNILGMNFQDEIFLRTSRMGTTDIFADAVHEGTHALDWLAEPARDQYWTRNIWESRARYYELKFQEYMGRPVKIEGYESYKNFLRQFIGK